MGKKLFLFAVLLGALSVLIGAFGAHGLKNTLTAEMKVIYETANKYHFYHSLALLVTSILYMLSDKSILIFNSNLLKLSGLFFIVGIVVFSFSLYAMAITNIRLFGMITPIGGVSFILGWIFLAFSIRTFSNTSS